MIKIGWKNGLALGICVGGIFLGIQRLVRLLPFDDESHVLVQDDFLKEFGLTKMPKGLYFREGVLNISDVEVKRYELRASSEFDIEFLIGTKHWTEEQTKKVFPGAGFPSEFYTARFIEREADIYYYNNSFHDEKKVFVVFRTFPDFYDPPEK